MEFITPEFIYTALSAFVGLLIGAGFIGAKVKSILAEVKEAVDSHKRALSPDSPGGADVTPEERAKTAEESLDVIEEVVQQYGNTLIGKIIGL